MSGLWLLLNLAGALLWAIDALEKDGARRLACCFFFAINATMSIYYAAEMVTT